ncbi:aminoglycoside phosphotransferase family protein [Patescibacteria group bacterium]|nr:aminoglycoside phosphotransferase family protein [Patescibacteria group bacterium]
MNNPINKILEKVQKKLEISKGFEKVEKGTRSEVYLSKDFIVKINENSTVLQQEGSILRSLDFAIVPKVIDFFIFNGHGVLVEKRLLGESLDEIWKNLRDKNKNKIIEDLTDFVFKINKVKYDYFWSVQYNKKFKSYDELLFHKFRSYKEKISGNEKAYELFRKISDYIQENKIKEIFSDSIPVLVHGDLIIHNLLSDGGGLTGVLDWEYVQYGDVFYDLARVIYYQECAKAYVEEGRDEFFEYDFTTRLIDGLQSKIKFDGEKYRIIRSFYFIDTIIWALTSKESEKNLSGLTPPVFREW